MKLSKTERFILVQIDKEGTERVLYQDFVGSFTTSDSASYAQDFKSEENAKKIAETLNLFISINRQSKRCESCERSCG